MSRSTWRRGALGICVLALLGVTTAGAPLAGPDPLRITGQPPGDPEGSGSDHDVGDPWTRGYERPSEEARGQTGSEESGSAAYVPASYTESGIPEVALGAYRNGAELIGRTDPACHLHWSLLAAIGRVESDHGRHGGTTVARSGETSPPILGLVLDGSNGTAHITDSDDGRLDGDPEFDRAVGPMQFLPGTWAIAGTDGNGDGEADPNNIFDAAASAGRYLCAGDVDLSDPDQLRDAVFSYNHSPEYVNLVLSIAADYREGVDPAGTPAVPGTVEDPEPLDPPDDGLPPATSDDPPGNRLANEPRADSPDRSGDRETGERGQDPGRFGRDVDPGDNEDPKPGGDDGGDSDGKSPPTDGGDGPPGDEDPTDPGGGDTSPGDGQDPPGEPGKPIVVDGLSTSQGTSQGAVGDTVTVAGSNLADATASFADEPADTVDEESTDEELVVEAPPMPEAGPVKVTVHSKDGVAAKGSPEFTYLPAIESIDPARGSTEGGDKVTIAGTSLKDAQADFGGEVADTMPDESTGKQLTVLTPPRARAEEISVTVRGMGKTEAPDPLKFTYHEPSISLTPEAGQPGEDVTITAHYTEFKQEPTVVVDGTRVGAENVQRAATELVVTLPPHDPGKVKITVARPGGGRTVGGVHVQVGG